MVAAIIVLLCAGCQTTGRAAAGARQFDVRAYGATGDGKTKDTAAFQRALDAAAQGGGEVVVPAGNYLIGSVVIGSNTTLRFDTDATLTGSPDKDDYPLMTVRWEGEWRDGHRALLSARDAHDIAIVGPGHIVGNFPLGHLRNPRGPCIIETIECRNIRLEDFSVGYERMWAIHPTDCSDFAARNLTIRSKLDNGDGIDVDSTAHVRISQCDIDTGDDAIALKSGRGAAAVKANRPTRDVVVTDCTLGSRFAGLAMGTEMSGGISDVRVERCTFTRGSNSIYLKSRLGRGGYMENITGKDLDCGASCFLRIDLLSRGIQASDPVPGLDGIPRVGNISFSDVRSTCPTLVDATKVPPEKPVQGLTLRNITGTCRRAIALANMRDVKLENIDVTGFAGPKLAVRNVEGDGLEGAAQLREPAPAAATTGSATTHPVAVQ